MERRNLTLCSLTLWNLAVPKSTVENIAAVVARGYVYSTMSESHASVHNVLMIGCNSISRGLRRCSFINSKGDARASEGGTSNENRFPRSFCIIAIHLINN